MPEDPVVLRAWLYDVDPYGMSQPMRAADGRPLTTRVPAGASLHVSVDGGWDTADRRFLRLPQAAGMASEPVTVGYDRRVSYWTIRNSGQTNTLRVQQYGLPAVPLRPRTAMPLNGADVAVWIPVVPTRLGPSEAFRLLVLAAPPPPRRRGQTAVVTGPQRMLSPAMEEAVIAYFGDHLSWPPLPAPHVRQQKEVEDIAVQHQLPKYPSAQHWARNRHDVLAGRDGLFTAAGWYPRLGGPDRTLANHLAAFQRLVELGSIRLDWVRKWTVTHDVRPYVLIGVGNGPPVTPRGRTGPTRTGT